MEPYQRAGEETRRQGEAPLRLAKTGLSIAGSALGGAAIGRVMPLLNELIPQSLAIKGLSKIDSRFGKFINTVLDNGGSFDEAKNFIKEKAESSQPKPDQRSILEQYSPELFQFIQQQIQGGRPPLEAGALAQSSGKYKKEIDKMTKDHKTPFSSILESIFGTGQTKQPSGDNLGTMGREEALGNFRNKIMQPQQMQQQAQQPGQGQQALMAILQKIQQSRGS